MTCEILFRGKRIGIGDWVEGGIYRGNFTWIIATDEFGKFKRYMVEPSTVGQYTGLTDKNGKQIFEGDLVKFRTRTSAFNKPLYVRWYGETAQFLVSLPDGVRSYPVDKSWEYEVIGNIHDNPDLLKEEPV